MKKGANAVKAFRPIMLAAIIAVLILSLSLAPLRTSAAEVWSDNFDDGDYDGWTIDTGDFTAADGMLTANGSVFSVITCESNLSEGTWSFDMIDPDLLPLVGQVNFMASANSRLSGTAFVVGFFGGNLVLAREGSGGGVFLAEWPVPGLTSEGLHHIGVTRVGSLFEVYHNGTHRISCDTLVPDIDYAYFLFGADTGSLDNIVVSDTIDVVCDNGTCTLEHIEIPTTTTQPPETTTTPTTTTTDTTTPPPPIPVELLAIGIGVPVVIVVIALIWRSRSS